MEHTFEAWGELDEIAFLNEAPPFENFSQALEMSVQPAVDEDKWFENLHAYLWGLRRLFWLELIPTGRIRVRFSRDGQRGEGIGPETLFRARSSSPLVHDPQAWPPEGSLILRPNWFWRSDQLYMECFGESLFSWKDVSLVNLNEIDLESDLFELSFSSLDVVMVPELTSRSEWVTQSPESQAHIVNQVTTIIDSQVDEFGEVMVDPRDILALIAAHPQTLLELADYSIFEMQHEILALAE